MYISCSSFCVKCYSDRSALTDMTYKRKPMTQREVEIIQNLKKKLKLPVTHIAKAVERNKTSVYKALKVKGVRKNHKAKKRGAPKKLAKSEINRILRVLHKLIRSAKGQQEITLAMLMKRAKVKVSASTLKRELRKCNVKFRRMRIKPLLTKADKKERFSFAKKYRKMSVTFWRKVVQMHIDCKTFPVYANALARVYAAQREVRGAYRLPKQGLGEGYVIVSKSLKFNPGPRAVKILAGVGKGRMLLWHDYGRKWNGKVAADSYLGPVKTALSKAWPRAKKHLVLEDTLHLSLV